MATPEQGQTKAPKCPLWFHQGAGVWAKKIKGRHVDFSADLEQTLRQYEAEKASWQAGINPREQAAAPDDPTVADVCNGNLASQENDRL